MVVGATIGGSVIAAGILAVPAVKGALAGLSLTTLNAALAALYLMLVIWGMFSTIYAAIADEEGAKVNIVSYIAVTTLAHYGITFGGSQVFNDLVTYPVQPELLFRALDVTVLLSASTVMVFFFDPDSLAVAPLVGSGLMTVSMVGQTYKAGTILQGIVQGTRDDATGKLLSAME